MTKEERLKCIEHNLDAFKKMVLAKASEVPPQVGRSRDQTVGDGRCKRGLGVQDARVADASIPDGEAGSRAVVAERA